MLTGEPLPITKRIGDKVIGATPEYQWFPNHAFRENWFKYHVIPDRTDGGKLNDREHQCNVWLIRCRLVRHGCSSHCLAYPSLDGDVRPRRVELGLCINQCCGSTHYCLSLCTRLGNSNVIMVATGQGATRMVCCSDAAAIENLRKIDTLIIDKTGTLTEGRPVFDRVVAASGFDESEVLRLAASLDQGSEHRQPKRL